MRTAATFCEIESEEWSSTRPDIWSYRSDLRESDLVLSLAKTLFDQPRWVEARYLYDERGSHLFQRICELPEYYLTRTEASILSQQAGAIISTAQPDCIVELGAGSAQKTTYLLAEQVRQLEGGTYVPIDVSLAALAETRATVRSHFPRIRFQGLNGRYEEAVPVLDGDSRKLFIFLGSTVGNLTPVEFGFFFNHLTGCMGTGDYFLLGIDRVKDRSVLEKAYNDSSGITSRFILNAFNHINEMTGSCFDLSGLDYLSFYSSEWNRVEMYAVAQEPQEIRFPSLKTGFLWEAGERVLVEISRKFDPVRLQNQLRLFELEPQLHFTDSQAWFSLLLFQKVAPGRRVALPGDPSSPMSPGQ